MSLTLLLKYRQGNNILALAQQHGISDPDLTQLQSLVNNSHNENEIIAIIQKYPAFNDKYQILIDKAKDLQLNNIMDMASFERHIKKIIEQPALQDIVINELESYQKHLDNYFTSNEFTREQLEQVLQAFSFLYRDHTTYNTDDFIAQANTVETDLTGELAKRKSDYKKMYDAYISSVDFKSFRNAHIWLNDTISLCSFNSEFQKYGYQLDPENIIAHLSRNYGITLSAEYISQLEAFRSSFRKEYILVYQNAHQRIYSLEKTKFLETLCQLIIKFNELACKQRGGSASHNGFSFVTQNNSDSFAQEYVSALEPLVQFAFDPIAARKNALAAINKDIPDDQGFSLLFLEKDFMRSVGLEVTTLYDQHQQPIDISKLKHTLQTDKSTILALHALSLMHSDIRVQRTISHIAHQTSSSILNKIINKIIHQNGHMVSPQIHRKIAIRVIDNKIIYDEQRIYYKVNADLTRLQMPFIYVDLHYEIPFSNNLTFMPTVQSFGIKIATTRSDPQQGLQIIPTLCGEEKKDIEHTDLLFPYLKDFMYFLGIDHKMANKIDLLVLSGICDLFSYVKRLNDKEILNIKKYILDVYQGHSNWLALSIHLLTIAKHKRKSQQVKGGTDYSALLRIAQQLSLTVISNRLANISIASNGQSTESDKDAFNILKLLALLSDDELVFNFGEFDPIILEKINSTITLFNLPNFITYFFQKYKNYPAFPALISGIITLAHKQILLNHDNKNLYENLKKIGSELLFKLLEDANQYLPDDPTTFHKGDFKRAAELNLHALHTIKITNNKLSRFNCRALQRALQNKFKTYYTFAKNHLNPANPMSEQERQKDRVREIIYADKSNRFLKAANANDDKISKSRLLNILRDRAKSISLALFNYFDLLKVFNAPRRRNNPNLLNIEPGSNVEAIDNPQQLKLYSAESIIRENVVAFKRNGLNLLKTYLSALPNKESYSRLFDNLFNNKITDYIDATHQLASIYRQLPINSPLKNILAEFYITYFLSSKNNPDQAAEIHARFDEFFNDFELLQLALSHALETPQSVRDTYATEFVAFILNKIKQAESRSYFITRAFLNKLNRKELTQLAVLDKSGEVAKYLLNTGFWDKWRQNHPSKKLNPTDIARIILAHADKEHIINRAFAPQGKFGGRNFAEELSPEDLANIYVKNRVNLAQPPLSSIRQLQVLYDQLSTNSPLKAMLALVYVPSFLSTPRNEFTEDIKNAHFEDFFKNFELLKLALVHSLKTPEAENDTITNEFLAFILRKIEQPEYRRVFITRSFLNKLTNIELTQLAIFDKSGEVAKYLLNTGFWDKWRGNHPSKKLNHVDITRIVMAHHNKKFVINRSFAAQSIFGGRNFSYEFLPEDLSCIHAQCDFDLTQSTHVNHNDNLRDRLNLGIYMQKTWFEMIVEAPHQHISELIELTRLNDSYLVALVKKYSEEWQKLIPDLAQQIESSSIKTRIMQKLVEISSELLNNLDNSDNRNVLIEIFSETMQKSFFIENILPKLQPGICSAALIRAKQLHQIDKLNIVTLFIQNNDLKQLVTAADNTVLESYQLREEPVLSSVPSLSRRSSQQIDAATIRRMGLSLSSIWSSIFSIKSQSDTEKPGIDEEIIEAEKMEIRP